MMTFVISLPILAAYCFKLKLYGKIECPLCDFLCKTKKALEISQNESFDMHAISAHMNPEQTTDWKYIKCH